jgi:hypothetical protein
MPMGRNFGLSETPGRGVCCSEDGAFVGGVPLFERRSSNGFARWQPRLMSALNRDLSLRDGLPVDFKKKIDGLEAVGRALNRGDLIHAQIATLHLQIPNPPPVQKSVQTSGEMHELVCQLQMSSMLKSNWDPAKHPH